MQRNINNCNRKLTPDRHQDQLPSEISTVIFRNYQGIIHRGSKVPILSTSLFTNVLAGLDRYQPAGSTNGLDLAFIIVGRRYCRKGRGREGGLTSTTNPTN